MNNYKNSAEDKSLWSMFAITPKQQHAMTNWFNNFTNMNVKICGIGGAILGLVSPVFIFKFGEGDSLAKFVAENTFTRCYNMVAIGFFGALTGLGWFVTYPTILFSMATYKKK
jgi:hypothetical protein